MYLLLPMDSDNIDEAKLATVADAKVWLQLQVEEGEIVARVHHERFDGFEKWSEAVVFTNDTENPMPFLEMSMMPLVAHTQRTIDEVVEAYLFRELHDLGY